MLVYCLKIKNCLILCITLSFGIVSRANVLTTSRHNVYYSFTSSISGLLPCNRFISIAIWSRLHIDYRILSFRMYHARHNALVVKQYETFVGKPINPFLLFPRKLLHTRASTNSHHRSLVYALCASVATTVLVDMSLQSDPTQRLGRC